MRYMSAYASQVSFGIEATKYSKASAYGTYFGLTREDVDLPNPNPQTPMASGGERRGPHVNSPDPREYTFDIPCNPVDAATPYEIALGTRTTTAQTGYSSDLFTESDVLPTATIAHHQDGDLAEFFTGCKAGLSLSVSQGEPLSATFSVTAAGKEDPTTSYSGSPEAAPDLSVPEITPFRHWMMEPVDVSRSADSTAVGTIETTTGFDFSVDNGLTANHHGGGRDAYSVSEETSEEKFDCSASMVLADHQWYEEAYDDGEPMDFEFLLNKDPTSAAARGSLTDAMYIRLLGTTIDQANSPSPTEGKVESDISLMPKGIEIEVHTPA